MAEYSLDTELTYRTPRSTEIPLNQSLASTIRSFQKSRRESLHHLCLLAYGLRRSNLVKTKGRGGNAQGQILSDRFKAWYKNEKLAEVYGSESNFTTYAMCGRLLEYTRWQLDKKKGSKFIDALPASLGTMYEISKVLWRQGDKTTPKGRETYLNWLTKPIGDGSPPKVFINPSLTRKEVVAAAAKEDESAAPPARPGKPPPSQNKQREVSEGSPSSVLATISVSEKSFSFTKAGKSKGASTERILDFERELAALIKKYGRHFSVNSSADALVKTIDDLANPDFGKHLR